MPPVVRNEMHLVSLGAHGARGEGPIAFRKGETILTECSYTDGRDEFMRLAARAGGNVERVWTDAQGWFSVQSGYSPVQ